MNPKAFVVTEEQRTLREVDLHCLVEAVEGSCPVPNLSISELTLRGMLSGDLIQATPYVNEAML